MEKYEISIERYKGPTDEELSPEQLFKKPYDDFIAELEEIKELNRHIPKIISSHVENSRKELREKMESLDEEGKKDLARYDDWWKKVRTRENLPEKLTLTIEHPILAKILNDGENMIDREVVFGWFLRKMSVVYLVSTFDIFLRNVIADTFLVSPSLVNDDVSLRFEDVFDDKKIDELRGDLAYQKADDIIRKGIDGISNNLKKIFKLDLQKNDDFQAFKEIFYRRNILVHNQGQIDKVYLEKTKKSINDVRVTEAYVSYSISLFEKYGKNIWTFYNKKYFSRVKIVE